MQAANATPSAKLTLAAAVLWPSNSMLRNIVLALLGSVAIALSAKIQIPFWPVPMTMQSFVILLIGVAYGARLAGATVGLYLLEGALGIPVFAGAGAGLAYMSGPTGGYLVGFLIAATLVGWLAERGWDRTVLRATAAMALGHVLLFVPGVLWLSVLFGFNKAIQVGLLPFMGATVFKTVLGVAFLITFWSAISRRHQGKQS